METCLQIFQLEFAGTVNRFLYYLKRLPLIGKLFPDSLYAESDLKRVFGIISMILGILSKLINKFLYLIVFIFLPVYFLYPKTTNKEVLLVHLLFFLSFVIGAVQSSVSTKNSVSSYNCVKLMKMNARQYFVTSILYMKLIEFILFLPTILITGMLMGTSPLKTILLSILLLCFRLFGEALPLIYYRLKTVLLYKQSWFLGILYISGIVCAYLPIILQHPFPINKIIFHPVGIIMIVAIGAASLLYILKYPLYDKTAKAVIIKDDLTINNNNKANTLQFKDVEITDKDFSQSSSSRLHLESKSGYDYLTALFFERHRRMIWTPVLIRLGIIVAIVLLLVPLVLLFSDISRDLPSQINTMQPIFVFIMYLVSIGERVCRAMFYNCDISLLRYSFYRQPSVILLNFQIRLRRIAVMNLLTALSICAGLTILMITAGGTAVLPDLLPLLLSILCLSLFFSVHHLCMYYVFQPYTTELNIKNPFYKTINLVVYFICFLCTKIKSPPPFFAVIVIAATLVYIIAALILTYRLSPKTFRVK